MTPETSGKLRGSSGTKVGFVALFAVGCSTDAPTLPARTADLEPNQARLFGVSVERFEADRLRTQTRLESADVDRTTLDVAGRSAVVTVHDESTGAVRATVRAPRANAKLGEQTYRLEGGVVITDDEGRRLTTAAADYAAKTDRLVSDGAVRVEGDNFEVDGSRLVGQPRAGRLTIEGPVRSKVLSSPNTR